MHKKISNWGLYPKVNAEISNAGISGEIEIPDSQFISRGLGRSYGDASLATIILDCTSRNQILQFDATIGLIECEAGVTLNQILEAVVPHGWFPAVTPGTANVTVGGAISSNVHGKNHFEKGTFSNFVTEIKVQLASGEIVICAAEKNSELFNGICGGMGLLGIIVSAKIQLQKISSSYFTETSIRSSGISSVIQLLMNNKDEFGVAWLNCYTQTIDGIFSSAHYTSQQEFELSNLKEQFPLNKKSKINIPFAPPFSLLNRFNMKLYNRYIGRKKLSENRMVHYNEFHYPLDNLNNWNRLYGSRGMLQYQFVLPDENAEAGMQEIFDLMKSSNCESYLAVVKRFGDEKGILSFPMKGICVALDFPLSKKVFELMNKMDEVVVKAKGRFYLAKDARMSREVFLKTQPRVEEFLALKKKYDPQNIYSSLQSKRLMGV